MKKKKKKKIKTKSKKLSKKKSVKKAPKVNRGKKNTFKIVKKPKKIFVRQKKITFTKKRTLNKKKIKKIKINKKTRALITSFIRIKDKLRFNFLFKLNLNPVPFVSKFLQSVPNFIESYKIIWAEERERKKQEKIKQMELEKQEAIKRIKLEKELIKKQKEELLNNLKKLNFLPVKNIAA